jgi:hypothetical protein
MNVSTMDPATSETIDWYDDGAASWTYGGGQWVGVGRIGD